MPHGALGLPFVFEKGASKKKKKEMQRRTSVRWRLV
jgi:hypothetical protein